MAVGFPNSSSIGSDRHEYASLQVTVFTLSKAIVAALEDEGASSIHHLARGNMTHEETHKKVHHGDHRDVSTTTVGLNSC